MRWCGSQCACVCAGAGSLALLALLVYTNNPASELTDGGGPGSEHTHAHQHTHVQPQPLQQKLVNTTTTTAAGVANASVGATAAPAPAAPPASPAPPRAPAGAVLTRSLYVAGHSPAHPELCPALGRAVSLLVLVTSAPGHATPRAGLRLTWGHFAQRQDVALGFLVGRTHDANLSRQLDAEDQLYGDIIRGNFVDSYSNLTLKTVSMLEWTQSYCPRARFLLKTDDDMFINVPRLLDFANKRRAERRVIYGKVVRRWGPNRSVKSKYYVSRAQFPAKVFPNFATGPAYLVSGDCVGALYARALSQPFVRLEDVLVTGVLAQQLGVRRVHAPEFLNKKTPPQPCTVQRAISIHMVRYTDQFDLWRKLLDGRAKC